MGLRKESDGAPKDELVEARFKERQRLIEDIDERRLEELGNAAWYGAKKQALIEAKKSHYGELTLRSKQKVVGSYLYGLLDSKELRDRVSEWALENPGDALRMIVNTLPKEVDVTTTHEGSIVLVPARMGNVQQWLDAAGPQTMDADVVEDVVPEADPEKFWKERMG
jgi:hypothetical protein